MSNVTHLLPTITKGHLRLNLAGAEEQCGREETEGGPSPRSALTSPSISSKGVLEARTSELLELYGCSGNEAQALGIWSPCSLSPTFLLLTCLLLAPGLYDEL